LKPLAEQVGVRAVFGEPVHAHGRTFIPVAKVTYGFGFRAVGASGTSRRNKRRKSGNKDEGVGAGSRPGGSAGGWRGGRDGASPGPQDGGLGLSLSSGA
jgi:uncharacterized spore protein YtfJ